MSNHRQPEYKYRQASDFQHLRDRLETELPDHTRSSLSQLPNELLLLIGEYLSPEARATLCFTDEELVPVFANQFGPETASLALLQAAQVGDIKTAQRALEKGTVDVNHSSQRKRTPLSFAAERGDVTMTQLLLEAEDIDIYREDDLGISALSWASRMGHVEIVDLLISADAKDDWSCWNFIRVALGEATSYGQKEVVKRLLKTAKDQYDFHGIFGYGNSLLCSAAMDGQKDIVKLYLAAGISPNATDGYGNSALYLASGSHNRVMKLLIKAGADVNQRAHDKRTPLIEAVLENHEKGVKILLSVEDIDISMKDCEGESALSIAKGNKSTKIREWLRAAQKERKEKRRRLL